ncbi:hypothetical protein Gotur_020536 [Gossypium turneri]
MQMPRFEVPAALVMEILSKLPVKSLTRFNCVCKYWCSFFRTPHFISKHYHNPSSVQAILMPVFILTTVLLCLILKLMTTNSYDLLLFLLLILNMKMHLLKICPKLSCILLNVILGRKFHLLIIPHVV